jgi:hypothetical protein
MAEHRALEVGTASADDYDDRRRTYRGFLRLLKWSVVGIAAVLLFLVWYAY